MRALRFTPRPLEGLHYQNEIAAVAAGIHVGAQFCTAALGPVAILQRLSELFFVGASAKRHACLRSASICFRSRRAIFRRARNNSSRMPAALSPVISAISRCE